MLDETRGLYVDKGMKVELSIKETKLLYYLIRNKKRLCLYGELTKFLGYGICDKYAYQSLVVLTHKLRKKLKKVIDIKSVMRMGYTIQYKGN